MTERLSSEEITRIIEEVDIARKEITKDWSRGEILTVKSGLNPVLEMVGWAAYKRGLLVAEGKLPPLDYKSELKVEDLLPQDK